MPSLFVGWFNGSSKICFFFQLAKEITAFLEAEPKRKSPSSSATTTAALLLLWFSSAKEEEDYRRRRLFFTLLYLFYFKRRMLNFNHLQGGYFKLFHFEALLVHC